MFCLDFAKSILALQRSRLGSTESHSPENLLHLIMTSYISRKTFNKDSFNSLPIFTIEKVNIEDIQPKPACKAGFQQTIRKRLHLTHRLSNLKLSLPTDQRKDLLSRTLTRKKLFCPTSQRRLTQ
jgi:hypothetical protein